MSALPKDEFNYQCRELLKTLLNPGAVNQTSSKFHSTADDILRGLNAYEDSSVGGDGKERHLVIGQIALECMIVSLKWSLQNIEDFELKEKEQMENKIAISFDVEQVAAALEDAGFEASERNVTDIAEYVKNGGESVENFDAAFRSGSGSSSLGG